MKIQIILFASLLLQTGLLPGQERSPNEFLPDPKAAKLNQAALKTLSKAMQKQVANGQVSGVIGLIANHNRIGYYETFGLKSIEGNKELTKDTVYRIFSMTKPIVTATAMSLWEDGKFKLDDPISKHCPEWENITVRIDGKVVPATSPVTPRQLMTHSSGMNYDNEGLKMESSTTLEEFSQSVAKRPLQFQPGTDYQYSYSIDILGRYIEAIEGKSLDLVVRERILDKLEMNETEFWLRQGISKNRLAELYTKKGKNGKLKPAEIEMESFLKKPVRMMGGQGMLSTTEDYARFCQMLTNKGNFKGKQVLKTATVELMFQNHLKDINKIYGLGGHVEENGVYRWAGAAGTQFWIDAKNQGYGVFMIQAWNYKRHTYPVFILHAKKAVGLE